MKEKNKIPNAHFQAIQKMIDADADFNVKKMSATS